jgi:hypothetical protein
MKNRVNKTSLYTKQSAIIIWITYALLGDMSSGSVCAPYAEHQLMHLHVLCEWMEPSGSSADLRNSSSMVQKRTITLPLILPHKKTGMVSWGLRGGHVNGVGDVDNPLPIQRPGKWSFKTSLSERVKSACVHPIMLHPGRCVCPIVLQPGRCVCPIVLHPGRRVCPIVLHPGRCVCPIVLHPGRSNR